MQLAKGCIDPRLLGREPAAQKAAAMDWIKFADSYEAWHRSLKADVPGCHWHSNATVLLTVSNTTYVQVS